MAKLLEIKDKYGDERLTKIVAAEGEIDVEDLIKEEQTVIALTRFGYIKNSRCYIIFKRIKCN